MGEIKPFLEGLEKDSYDLLLVTTYSRTWLDDLVAVALRASTRIAVGDGQAIGDELSGILSNVRIAPPYRFYDACISVEERSHETEKYQALWEKIAGTSNPLPKPRLIVPDDAAERAGEFLAAAGFMEGAYVFCFPAGVSNVSLKAWPEEKFAEVIVHLEKNYSLKTVVAAHESEKGIVDKVAEVARFHGANPLIWLGKDGDIPLACALVGQSSFYLGNDTGMMHMAAALEKPVIAIFGGGTWPRFLPVVDIGAVFTQELPCFYCKWSDKGNFCWLGDAPCIKSVVVEDVFKAVENLLQRTTGQLETRKGVSLDEHLLTILDKGYQIFKKLRRERKHFIEEAHRQSIQLSELHKVYKDTLEEIGKRDGWLSELREVYHQAVEEIGKRDGWLSELREVYHQAVEEIGKRDGWLSELRQVNEQALRVLPLVSIITPVLNGSKWIESCIQSVSNQDYPKIEHIIVDGGSTDGTLDICRKYPHLIIQTKKDRGQSHAINKGFSMAQGDILAWLCADDIYELGAVKAAVQGILAGNDVIIGLSRFIDANGNDLGEHPGNAYDHYDHGMLLRFWQYTPISQPATFWTRKVWEACGPVKENLFFAMDYDLWLRMSKKADFNRVNINMARYRLHPEAKCYADNFSPRIELINVSRHYWPPFWHPLFWALNVRYWLTRSSITKHYAEAERRIQKVLQFLDASHSWCALFCFFKAHVRHPATPFLPGYRSCALRIAQEFLGSIWSPKLGVLLNIKKVWRKEVRLSFGRDSMGMDNLPLLKVQCTGYWRPQFRFWGKKNGEFILLRDWRVEDTFILSEKHKGFRDYGVHIRSGDNGDFQDQAWVKNEAQESADYIKKNKR
jgi:glycosyltransferase involved in cell wall biosynthesis/ADP-heptose:LPS heptosyltransferase